MKKYLEKMADEIDYLTTQLEGECDWREQIISVICKHIKKRTDKVTLNEVLEDMREVAK
jgi:septum formation topological specificity factor MinE